MSAPDSTSSKGRPSLLSETAPGAGDSSSRILASLEGRAVAQPLPRRRSKKPLMIAALAVIGFGALGAWQLQRGQQGESVATAAAPATGGSAVEASAGKVQAAAGGASAVATAAVVNASGVSATAGGASTPQAAVIVADDSTRADTSVAAASGSNADSDRLSRALAGGSAPTLSPALAVAPGAQPDDKRASAAVAAAGSASSTNAAAKRAAPAVASRTDRQTAKSRHSEKVAAAHASKRVKGHASSVKDDPDADLLAALVARTKPYEPKAPSANAVKGGAATKAARPAADAHRGSLADKVKACDKGNFFEAQACRWRVCSDHWGTDSACPSTASAAQTH
ncbi:MAG TPA: hypothetical protein VL635_05075 [Trinickia sp.]|nr:hypothetical protein [Trinickia sp.]